MEIRIHGTVRPEAINGSNFSVLAPGFEGRFVSVRPGAAATRAKKQPGEIPLASAASLSSVSVIVSGVIELEPPLSASGASTRSRAKVAPKLIVKARAGQGYALLHTDEFGRKRWLFPDMATSDSAALTAMFTLPSESAPVVASAKVKTNTTRGLVTMTMRRVVSVVTWATSPLVKATAQKIASAWEAERRPYGLWQVAAGGDFAAADWRSIGSHAALLVIHGTFSTPTAGFGTWFESEEFGTLVSRYGGRVLAFAHPSLSVTPGANIDWLLDQLPGKSRWSGSFDVVCHSRGGLVARELAARSAAGKAPAVDRVCQVGAPNLGTVLADPKRWVEFLDTYTNCLTSLPDATSTIVLEGLLCLVKIIGTGATDGLPGLAAMNPQGEWIRKLGGRSTGGARWYTVGTNYVPSAELTAGFIRRVSGKVADAALDAFFTTGNDMVVPSAGCHNPGVAPVDSLSINDGKTMHTSYFESSKVRQTLVKWLA